MLTIEAPTVDSFCQSVRSGVLRTKKEFTKFIVDCLIQPNMGQYQLLSVLAARLSPLNIDHSGNLPVEICGINYTEKYTNL